MKFYYAPLLLATIGLSACDRDNNPPQVKSPLTSEARYSISVEEAGTFASWVGLSAYTSFSLAAQEAQELDGRLQSFLYHPNPMTLNEARQAWRKAYSAYLETLLYSTLPLNDPPDWSKTGIDLRHTMKLLDSWPIEGGYIDHVPGYAFSGIVNDLALELTEDNVLAQHGFSDETYASVGFHPFEFMLWGAEGQRSPRDFFPQENTAPVVQMAEGGSGEGSADEGPASADVQNHNRRRQYVQLLSEELQKHIHRLQRRWEPSNGYYATLLQRSQPAQVVTATFNTTQKLLSDELLASRLKGNSSEFSGTSADDIAAILHGLRVFYLSNSETGSPAGLAALLPEDKRDAQLAEWEHQLTLADEALMQWQLDKGSDASRQQVRQRVIELMSVLKQTALLLSVPLADE